MSVFKILVNQIIKKIFYGRGELQAQKVLPLVPEKSGFKYPIPLFFDIFPEKVKWHFRKIFIKTPKTPELNLHIYQDVYVSYEGVIFTNFQVSVPSLCYPALKEEYISVFLIKQWQKKKMILIAGEPVAVTYDRNSTGNYYHWLTETCPRLLLLREKFPGCLLMVPGPVPEYITATTAILGFPKLFPIYKKQVLKASEVILADQAAEVRIEEPYNFYKDPTFLIRVREELITGLQIQVNQPFRKVYVSRSRQKARKIINDGEIMKILKNQGFEIVFFETMNFKEQVQLMCNCSVLIGLHGANLTNILFMPAKTILIEIVNEDYINPLYYRLASYLNITYTCILGKNPPGDKTDNYSDIYLSPKDLEKCLKNIAL